MNKKWLCVLLGLSMLGAGLLAGCTQENGTEQTGETQEEQSGESQVAGAGEMAEVEDVVQDWMTPIYGEDLKDGSYPIAVDSSSSMFKITECTLTVQDGQMTAEMTMGGTGYLHLYMGTGEEAAAAAEGDYIPYTEAAEGVHSFTVPVAGLDMGIDCAAFSKNKEKWYDRTLVFRGDSLPLEAFRDGVVTTVESLNLADGEYTCAVTLSGGSGKTSVESPAVLRVENGAAYATLVWSSPNYDYMIVDGVRYDQLNTEGNSVFEVPVRCFDWNLGVIGDTVAMSEPHEIAYTLNFDSQSIQ